MRYRQRGKKHCQRYSQADTKKKGSLWRSHQREEKAEDLVGIRFFDRSVSAEPGL